MRQENLIHPTAIIDPKAILGSGNTIGPYCYIGAGVRLGDGNVLRIGVLLGGMPESRGKEATNFGTLIGSNNFFSDYVTVHRGTERPTCIGSDCYFMIKSHLAHDAWVEDGATIAGSVMIAGFTHLLSHVTVGSNASIHPHCVIGDFAMVGQNTSVDSHVEVAQKVYGCPARVVGVNTYKLEKLGLKLEELSPKEARFRELTASARGGRKILKGTLPDLGYE